MPESIAVVGAGAVGMFYGSKLQKSGLRVEYQSRKTAAALEKSQLQVKSIWGDYCIDARVFDSTSEMKKADIIILSTKVLDNINYSTLLAPIIKNESIIICLQNGIGLEEELQSEFSSCFIVGALAFTCINRTGTAGIEHLDYGLVKVGPLAEKDQKAARLFHGLLVKAEIEAEYHDNLRLLRWQKLLWNVPFNSLSVIGRADTGELVKEKPMLDLSKEIMREVQSIALYENCIINDDEIEEMLRRTINMKPYKTSMLLDFENKRPVEVSAILGKPISLAERYGIKVSCMRTLKALLEFLQQKNLGQKTKAL